MNYAINLADVIAVIFSIGALIISFKNRRNGLREKIFEEQVSSFNALSFKIARFESLIMDYNANLKISGDEFEEIREKIWDITDDLQEYYSAIEILIPAKVDKQFNSYHKYIDSVIKTINIGNEEIDVIKLSNENYAVQESIRNFIRLEKLSKENNRLSKSRYI